MTTAGIYQIKIELLHVRPTVWRRVLISDETSLAGLHHVIQAVMGWTDSHLHSFEIEAQSFGPLDPDADTDVLDEELATLGLVAGPGSTIDYVYDFGDWWQHRLTVEAALPADAGGRYPRCVAGARPCPPEDIGGPGAYAHFLDALADPGHPEHDAVRTRAALGPQDFDVFTADKRLETLAWTDGPAGPRGGPDNVGGT